MPSPARRRELARGDHVLPGVFRLRLPLPFPGVPHCNAWAVAADGGLVLFDCGMHEERSLLDLDDALRQVGHQLDDVRLLVCTHGHVDHYGQAAAVLERVGCELWMHPDMEHAIAPETDSERYLERRVEIARLCGVPEAPLRRWASERRDAPSGIAAPVRPARPLTEGLTVETDVGAWVVLETPGHAPSHICLYSDQQRLLISGDHLTGRIALYFDHGYSPDPVGEFLISLDHVGSVDARLALAGHGKPFVNVPGKIAATRALVLERLERVEQALSQGERSPFDLRDDVLDLDDSRRGGVGWVGETLAYLIHLERIGRAVRHPGAAGAADSWSTA
jgi:glyoxylase-like metal-dependent hydrolase (beta-lactamase superfamily II)